MRGRRGTVRLGGWTLALAQLGLLLLAGSASAGGPISLLTEANLRIDGAAANDNAGISVAAAGDVNGDGRDDIVIGAWNADHNGRTDSGSAYVVYGAAAPSNVDLNSLGSAGFRIDGAAAGDNAGFSVHATDDIDADGRDDIVVGAPNADNNSRTDSGSAYVVYGQQAADPADVDLAQIGTGGSAAARGMRIDGAAAGDVAGVVVAGAGDINHDGRYDVAVAARGADGVISVSRVNAGVVYVVYAQGTGDVPDIDLAGLTGAATTRGMRIEGGSQNSQIGSAVSSVGDFNGDGHDDLAMGAQLDGISATGLAWVIYGQQVADPADVSLAAPGSRGMQVTGAAGNDGLGISVAGAGDFNGDGRSDLIVGALFADNNSRSSSGSAYVIYGEQAADPTDVNLATGSATRWMRIDGASANDRTGASAAGDGDINGDGRDDVLVGAPLADGGGRSDSGSAYAVYGQGTADPADLDLAQITGSAETRGLRIDGASSSNNTVNPAGAGASVAIIADLDADGRAEPAIGAPQADNSGRTDSGSAYVVYGGSRLHHRTTTFTDPPPFGDGDGLAEPGETLQINSRLENLGGASITGISGTMSSTTPGVAIGAPTASWPDIGAGASAQNTPPFTATLSSSYDCTTPLRLSFAVASSSGSPSVPDKLIRIGARSFTTSGDVPKTIPDNNPAGVDSIISGLPGGTVAGLVVRIDGITHTFDADLKITLTHGGKTVVLFNRHGGNGDNITNLVFDDSAATAVSSAAAPFTGTFRPTSTLSDFDGDSTTGAWTLNVSDNAGMDVGTLNSWAIGAFGSCPAPPASPPSIATGAASGVTQDAATLNGDLDANGTATSYAFEWGTTTAYGNQTTPADGGSGTDPVPVSAALSALTPATTYHYRALALRGGMVLATGADQTFTTPAGADGGGGDPGAGGGGGDTGGGGDAGGGSGGGTSADTTPPETRIDAGPASKTRRAKATFAFSADEPATFKCSLDGKGFAPCNSPTTFRVKTGRHKLLVEAIDAAGNVDLTPASRTWKRKRRH